MSSTDDTVILPRPGWAIEMLNKMDSIGDVVTLRIANADLMQKVRGLLLARVQLQCELAESQKLLKEAEARAQELEQTLIKHLRKQQ